VGEQTARRRTDIPRRRVLARHSQPPDVVQRDFLDRAYRTLDDMQAHIMRAPRTAAPQARDGTKDDPSDLYDAATEEREREIQIILSDRDRTKLQAIDGALTRIREGNYGICEECGEDIAEGRLELLPFTRLCVTCQAELEREESQRRARPDHTRRDLAAALGGDFQED
jgi:DnaK suppressor protein